jgi:hypothetical protein
LIKEARSRDYGREGKISRNIPGIFLTLLKNAITPEGCTLPSIFSIPHKSSPQNFWQKLNEPSLWSSG